MSSKKKTIIVNTKYYKDEYIIAKYINCEYGSSTYCIFPVEISLNILYENSGEIIKYMIEIYRAIINHVLSTLDKEEKKSIKLRNVIDLGIIFKIYPTAIWSYDYLFEITTCKNIDKIHNKIMKSLIKLKIEKIKKELKTFCNEIIKREPIWKRRVVVIIGKELIEKSGEI